MKKKILKYFVTAVLLSFLSAATSAQCTPQPCADPENNGQVCPAIMPTAFINQAYSEVATILIPKADSTGVPLHHFTLTAVNNLPTGISWQSNAPGNVFTAGNSYCILLHGTPTVADTFYLRIELDIYIDFFGQPLLAKQVVDSTSLFMVVSAKIGINESLANLEINGNFPNPFSGYTSIRYNARQPGETTFEVYTQIGQKVHGQKLVTKAGENAFLFNGNALMPGTYIYVLRAGTSAISKMMVKIK